MSMEQVFLILLLIGVICGVAGLINHDLKNSTYEMHEGVVIDKYGGEGAFSSVRCMVAVEDERYTFSRTCSKMIVGDVVEVQIKNGDQLIFVRLP